VKNILDEKTELLRVLRNRHEEACWFLTLLEAKIADGDKRQLGRKPLPVIVKLGEICRDHQFRLEYFERGCGFSGTLVVENGHVISNFEGKYHGGRGG
jgi:hypothetical protein